VYAISFFDLAIDGRIDAVLPKLDQSGMTESNEFVRILESSKTTSITFQGLPIPWRLDLLDLNVESACPFGLKCVKETLRLLHAGFIELPHEDSYLLESERLF
jgi:hypothetical protein